MRQKVIDGLLIETHILPPLGTQDRHNFKLTLDNKIILMTLHQAACLRILIGETLGNDTADK